MICKDCIHSEVCAADNRRQQLGTGGKIMFKLKPCPFCGSKAWLDTDEPTNIQVRCLFCGITVSLRDAFYENDVIDAWNRRADNAAD